jgi:hypothetical protein
MAAAVEFNLRCASAGNRCVFGAAITLSMHESRAESPRTGRGVLLSLVAAKTRQNPLSAAATRREKARKEQ